MQARMQRGAAHPTKKADLKKSGEKKEKNNKIMKIYQNYHHTVYKWIKTDEFSRG